MSFLSLGALAIILLVAAPICALVLALLSGMPLVSPSARAPTAAAAAASRRATRWRRSASLTAS